MKSRVKRTPEEKAEIMRHTIELGVRGAAEKFGVSPSQIYEWKKNGVFPVKKKRRKMKTTAKSVPAPVVMSYKLPDEPAKTSSVVGKDLVIICNTSNVLEVIRSLGI